MRVVDDHALVEDVLSSVVAQIRAGVDRTGEIIFVKCGVTAVDRIVWADIPVHAGDGGPGVLRVASARIRRRFVRDVLAKGRAGTQPRNNALWGVYWILRASRTPGNRAQYLQAGHGFVSVGSEKRLRCWIDAGLGEECRIKDALGNGGLAAHTRPFRAAEEEQLVLNHRPANGVAELVAREVISRQAIGAVVIGVGGQVGDTVKFIQRIVEIVGSRLGGHVDYAAAGAPVLRGKVRGRDTKFLHRIQRNTLSDRCSEEVNVVAAIEQDTSIRRALTVDGHAGTTTTLHVFIYISGCRDQVVWIAGQSWKIRDLLRRNYLREGLVLGIHGGRFRRSCNFDGC